MTNHIKTRAVERLPLLSTEEFTATYKDSNTPVIITELTKCWPAVTKWSVDYLKQVAGEQIVPVYSSKPAQGKQHQHAAEKQLPLREYLSMLEAGENDLRMFFYNILENVPQLLNDFSYPDLGLSFFKRLPVLFVGGRGAKVQMHYDIDLANLILCHFGGPKRVLLIPPEQTQYMYKVPFSFSALHSVNFDQPDFAKHPALKQLNGYVAELQHGDALYIPSGYWHFIEYQDIGFSMTLRSMPTSLRGRATLLKNIFVTRTIEGLMRKLVGQKWNDRNERLALERTNRGFID
ncbi:cupin-like domain-containing protein [Arenicella xantha]|uniref:Cupin-like protein n=1 Tax=Arenicella xantha TaxID=644221 RepID=A0A395JT43_9GAMM|nr:cupin-like domain-containing protein [Arenicella xantha]RBP53715.1 cupin-like protein [Arenicella xantha]